MLTVLEYAVEWEGPHHPVTRPITLGTVNWKQLPGVDTIRVLEALINAARESRRSKYRPCRICEETKPPEGMHDEEVCQRCAEQHLGAVY